MKVVFFCAIVAVTMYSGKVQHKRSLIHTREHLALTEQLLGDEREEKERMDHAWSTSRQPLATCLRLMDLIA